MTSKAFGLLRGPASCLILGLLFFAGTLGAQRELTITGIPEEAPFKVRATADPSRLIVELDIKKGWHAYSRDTGGGEPIALSLSKGSGFARVGKLRLSKDKEGELHGRVKIEQWLEPAAGGDKKSKHGIEAKLNFMVCDPMQCLPPIELTISGKIEPLRVLLVTSSKDEHATRIQKFLIDRGFSVEATTYPEVDSKTCDAHEVILADSKLFREDGKGGRKARDFPKTKTPIVAVGFLGHLIVEAHGLAMTSGYI
jgi:Thiol:disulfide interchange protein DsbD, N-terminal